MKQLLSILTIALTAITLNAQQVKIELPAVDSTGNFSVTDSTGANLMKFSADGGFYLKGAYGIGAIPVEGAGTRMMWYPKKAAIRVGYVDGTQWDDANVGDYSTSTGYNTSASGWAAIALGNGAIANNNGATAIGGNTTASGNTSTALGHSTIASGTASTAIGFHTTAQAYASIVIGQYNIVTGTTGSWVDTEPLFVCGNGTSSTATSNALTLLKNGNLEISGTIKIAGGAPGAGKVLTSNADGLASWETISSSGGSTTLDEAYNNGSTITADAGAVTINGTDGLISTGTFGSGSALSESGAGTRMMWYPKKAAFRAGYASSTQWDDANIGDYSTATGSATTASGISSTAMGYGTTASGRYSTAIGIGNMASNEGSVALGYITEASGTSAVALGGETAASGYSATAMGEGTIASGDFSTSMGLFSTSQAYASTVIGQYNIVTGTTGSWIDTEPLFVCGNGTGTSSRSNALTLFKNGNLEISGTVKIAGGAPGAGKVLTSDANGLASWKTISTSGGSTSLDDAYKDGSTITANAGAVTIAGTDGLISTGTFGSGSSLSVSGAGPRFMWYPKKAAFRAGFANGTEWDDANIGAYSTAMGTETIAIGDYSTAIGGGTEAGGTCSVAMGAGTHAIGAYSTTMGHNTSANGDNSTAMGNGAIASGVTSFAMGEGAESRGDNSTAMGNGALAGGVSSIAIGDGATTYGNNSAAIGSGSGASGDFSTAMGNDLDASGDYSTAMGNNASTNSKIGAFIIGDNSASTRINSSADNQMTMRFAGGYRLFTNSGASVGMNLDAGANSWAQISDSTKKYAFLPVNGESVLNKIAKFNLRTWSYIGQDSTKYRHYGPMAQEFFNAFGDDEYGVAGNDTTINQADFMGVNLVAIKALVKRTKAQGEKSIAQSKKIAEISKEYGVVSRENEELKEKLSVVSSKLKDINIENEKTKEQLSKISKKNSELKEQLSEMKTENASLNKRFAKLEAFIAALSVNKNKSVAKAGIKK